MKETILAIVAIAAIILAVGTKKGEKPNTSHPINALEQEFYVDGRPVHLDGCDVSVCDSGGEKRSLPAEKCNAIKSILAFNGNPRFCLEGGDVLRFEDGTTIVLMGYVN